MKVQKIIRLRFTEKDKIALTYFLSNYGLSLRDLAKASKYNVSFLSQITLGRKPITQEKLEAILACMNCHLEILENGEMEIRDNANW